MSDLNQPDNFDATRWSLVLAAQGDDTQLASNAMAELCRIYWYPLYAYVRRSGQSPEDAEDLTQGFFAQLLSKDFIGSAEKGKGKLRAFLLTAIKRYMANEWKKANRQKRGGAEQHVPIDQEWAEERYQHEPQEDATPESLYERQWAMALLEQVQKLLRDEYKAAGKLELYEALKNHIAQNEGEASHEDIAKSLGMSTGAVGVAIHRLRKRYRKIFVQQVSQTTSEDNEVEDEVSYLFSLF